MPTTIIERIEDQLNQHKIVLYMKGTPEAPRCGFSSRAAHFLKLCNANFKGVNVLEDDDIREGIKQYGNWPTIPQLYINKKLIGGSDIISELYESGELQKLIQEADAS